MKRLQAEWKTIGPVRRNKSEVVWNRFRAAADKFFERYHNRHQIALAGKLAEREALVVELEALAAAEDGRRPESRRRACSSCARRGTAACRFPAREMQAAGRSLAGGARARRRAAGRMRSRGTDLDPAAVRPAHGKARRARRVVPRRTSASRRAGPVADRSCSPRGCGRRSRATRWAAARTKTRSGARRPTPSRKRRPRGSAWRRCAGPEARALEARFRDVCRRVMDQARRHAHRQRAERRDHRRPRASECRPHRTIAHRSGIREERVESKLSLEGRLPDEQVGYVLTELD